MAISVDEERVAVERCLGDVEDYLHAVLAETTSATVTLDTLAKELPHDRPVCEAAMVVVTASARNGCTIEREAGEGAVWRVERAG